MKLLVCSDGSERGSKVLALAARIAIASRAEVTVFGVTGTDVQDETVYGGLRRALKEYDQNGINVELVTRRGEPVTEIVKKTRETKYDLVVVGTHRKADERAVIPPAKAYAIIEEVEPPVLVAVGDARPLARILVCTGGGPCIATAVSVTAQMARSLPAAVTLLTVLPNLGGLHASLLMRREADAEALLRSNSALARDLGSEKRSLEALGVQVTVRLRYGLVADEILKELEQGGHDLVVVGACPDPNAWRRYLIGNVTREIVHRADRPILVVRGKPSSPPMRHRIRRAIIRMIRGVRRRRR
jgi:nucleotide-binding universal stress UspA family protein